VNSVCNKDKTIVSEEKTTMTKLLFVTCNLKPLEKSRSLTLGKLFLDEYLERSRLDEVDFLELYRDNIQRIDSDVLNGWCQMRDGQSFAALNADEQRKIARIWNHAEQFISADKYVFVTPMWNLSFPAVLKMYIDAICVAGKTFHYTATGPVGLLGNPGKRCLLIHSSGGFHFGEKEDHSIPYLHTIMNFMGIEEFEAIVLEGVDAFPEQAGEFNRRAVEKAIEVAARF
jgi:FMN-dependent NADH-azoreductase